MAGRSKSGDRDDGSEDEREPEPLAPVPGAPAAHDVLFAELRTVGAEKARPRDQSAEEEVDETAKGDHDRGGRDERPERAPAVVLVQPDEEGGTREDGDEGGRCGQQPRCPDPL